jgi:hypothetical protein
VKLDLLKYLLYKNKIVKRDTESGYMFAEGNKVNLNAWINPEKIMRVGTKCRRLAVSYNC